MSTDKADVYIDEKAVVAVDAKIRESQQLTKGLMSSWGNPMDGVKEGPKGKISPARVPDNSESSTLLAENKRNLNSSSLIKVPVQALKLFRQLLPLFEDVDVRLTPEQKEMFLESLKSMKTPNNMMDAKAIFELMEALSK